MGERFKHAQINLSARKHLATAGLLTLSEVESDENP